MTLPIGIPACTRAIRCHPQHATPARYGAEEDGTPGLHDPTRDATTLPLTREALRRDMPLLAVPWVQWHPEWEYASDTHSAALFRAYAGGIRQAA